MVGLLRFTAGLKGSRSNTACMDSWVGPLWPSLQDSLLQHRDTDPDQKKCLEFPLYQYSNITLRNDIIGQYVHTDIF